MTHGTRRITLCISLAAFAACGGDTATVPATPSRPLAAAISFEVAHAIVGVRASVRISPTVRDAQGSDVSAQAAIQWTTSDASFATVSDTGAVTGVRLGGPVTITATSNGHSASVEYTVTPASISIGPAQSTLAVNTMFRYSGVPVDAFGQPLDAGPVTWATSDPGIATVDQTGLVTAIAPGNTQIIASAGGRSSVFGLLVGIPSIYDGTFSSTSPPVTITVLFGSVTHFDGSFAPLATCSASVSITGSMPIGASGGAGAILPTGIQLSITFGSSDSATGVVRGPPPAGCGQSGSTNSMQYGQFVAHKG